MVAENGFTMWDGELKRELFTPEEIAENNRKAHFLCQLIAARNERGLSQRGLETLSGIKQPAIARIERGASSPTIDTLMKLLIPLGKTVAIVPLPKTQVKKQGRKLKEDG